jgi:hypothetical protein
MHGPTTELALPMKRSPWVLAISAALALYGVVKLYNFFTDPMRWETLPIENADGTVDYTLKAKWPRDTKPHYWIVRLPKDQFVMDGKVSASFSSGGSTVKFGSRHNERLSLDFQDLEFKNYRTSLEDNKDKDIVLWLNAFEELRSIGGQQQPGEEFGFSIGTRNCKIDGTIEPGLTRLLNDPSGTKISPCYIEDKSSRQSIYWLRSAKGIPVGNISCSDDIREPETYSFCSGRFFVGNGRQTGVSFPITLLPRAQYMHEQVEAYVKRITVRADVSESRRKRLAQEKINQ